MKKNLIIVLLFTMIKVEAQTSTFTAVDSLFAKGRYKIALSILDQMGSNFLSNYKKATIYESIDDFKNAASFYEKALTFKEDYKTKLKLAKNYRLLKKSIKAIKIYEKILAKDSLNLVLKYQLGKLYIINKKPKKAIATFKYLIDKDKTNANYSYYLGLSYKLDGQRDPMINSLIDTYKKDTLHFKAITRLATCFQKLKDKDSTQLFVNKGLALNKNHVDLNKLKINQLFRDKKYIDAIPLLLNLDTINKNDTYNMTLLGKAYYNLDSLKTAKKYFKKLSFLDKKDFKANTYLGHIAMKEKDYKTANFNYMLATFKGKEKRDEEYYGLATLYYETKKPNKAIKYFENAYKENSRNYRALYQLAKLSDDYYKEKKIAYKYYKKYVDNFISRDANTTAFVKNRIKEIKKEYFLRGESLN
ncbi:tetratricopeptide repeat protein [uncultured Polaribacter sp.]|uniref:tetratricopeptide repeat protein n=1 Tax=uncultured Polaribacter sp. TaxID=174711 RepID=UPI002608E9A5|nr:tetratricopeptide repeat protein [uncultured Polaribacter sp.]